MAQDVDLEGWVLAHVDGAEQPPMVEEIYVARQLRDNSMASRGWLDRVNNTWPDQGQAWRKLGPVLTALVDAGKLVTCSTADPDDHPHHALTQGHFYLNHGGSRMKDRFLWGEAPLVRRYFATPDLETVWSAKLADEAAATAAAQAQRRQEQDDHDQWVKDRAVRVYRAIEAGAATVPAIAAATGYRRSSVRFAIHQLVGEGRLRYGGRSRWGRHRWQAAPDLAGDAPGGR